MTTPSVLILSHTARLSTDFDVELSTAVPAACMLYSCFTNTLRSHQRQISVFSLIYVATPLMQDAVRTTCSTSIEIAIASLLKLQLSPITSQTTPDKV